MGQRLTHKSRRDGSNDMGQKAWEYIYPTHCWRGTFDALKIYWKVVRNAHKLTQEEPIRQAA